MSLSLSPIRDQIKKYENVKRIVPSLWAKGGVSFDSFQDRRDQISWGVAGTSPDWLDWPANAGHIHFSLRFSLLIIRFSISFIFLPVQSRDRRFPVVVDSDVTLDKVLKRYDCPAEDMQAVQANEIYSYSRRGR